MKLNRGFTLLELIIVIAVVGSLSTVAVVFTRGSIVKAQNIKRVTDIVAIASALEQEKGYFETGYFASATTPESIGTILERVPKNNLGTEDGSYSWFSNSDNNDIFCLWAELADTDTLSQKKYYIANQFGSGFFEDEPTELTSCGFYIDEHDGNEWYNDPDDEEEVEDEEVPDDTDKVYLCHKNKKGKMKTLMIAYQAVQAHLNQYGGSYLGQCDEEY